MGTGRGVGESHYGEPEEKAFIAIQLREHRGLDYGDGGLDVHHVEELLRR